MRQRLVAAFVAASILVPVTAVAAEAIPVPVKGNKWASESYARAHSRPCVSGDDRRCYVDAAQVGSPGPSYSVMANGTDVFWRYR
jgi:hypothetical protein